MYGEVILFSISAVVKFYKSILTTVDLFFLQEIKQLCTYLVDLKKASAEEMRRSVYANYAAFIRLVVLVCINFLKSRLVLGP